MTAPLECLIIPELEELQLELEKLGHLDALARAFSTEYNDAGHIRDMSDEHYDNEEDYGIDNAVRQLDNGSSFLTWLFLWDQTPQGYAFWNSVLDERE